MNPGKFLAELKRRNVYKVAVAYAVVAWLLIQVATQVFPLFEIPNWAIRLIVLAIVIGFPISLVIAWAFELTPQGIKRTEDSDVAAASHTKSFAWIYVVVVGALLSLGLFLLGRYGFRETNSSSTNSPAKSIAVLPFDNLSRDPDNAYFAEGVQDEILTRLSKIAELKVISRTSTQQYQSKPGNIAEIGRQLGVAYLLEGSVQKSGDSARVNVQLIEAAGDAHVWAETYDRKLLDVFAVESEVAERIARSLQAHLTGGEKEQIAIVPTRNAQAYDAYLRGLAFIIRESHDDVRKARDFFQQAVDRDPNYAQAWAQLSIAQSELYFDDEHTPERFENSKRAAETAVRLQPQLSDAHSALGIFYYMCPQDFDRALLELEEARKYSPNDGNVIFYTGLVKRRQGKLDEAIELQKKATLIDPRNPDMWANLGRSYRGKRDFRAAREMFDRAFAIAPDETDFIGQRAETFFAEGDLDAAEKLLRDPTLRGAGEATGAYVNCLFYRRQFNEAAQTLIKTIEGKKSSGLGQADDKSWLGTLKVMAGHEEEGRVLLEEARRELIALRNSGNTGTRLRDALLFTNAALLDQPEVERGAAELLNETKQDLWLAPSSEEGIAACFAYLGDADRAIPLLQHALSVSYYRAVTPALLRLDPIWDKIRNDPRFQTLAAGKL